MLSFERKTDEMARALRIEAETLEGEGRTEQAKVLRRVASFPSASLVRIFNLVETLTRHG